MKFWKPIGKLFPLCHYINLEYVSSISPIFSDGKRFGFHLIMADGVKIPFSHENEASIQAIHYDLLEKVGYVKKPRRVT